MPKVSIVVPVYNRENTVICALKSVLAQEVEDIEVVVVDDCSSDGTRDSVLSLHDGRVKYYQLEKNRGAAYARNFGVEVSSAPVVAFHDSDDVWRPGKLSAQLSILDSSATEICISRFERHGYPKNETPIIPGPDISQGWIGLDTILFGGIVGMPTVVAKRDFLRACPFDGSLRWCEDYEWSIRAASLGSIYLLDDVTVDVYLQPNSVTIVNDDKKLPFYEKLLGDDFDICSKNRDFLASAYSGYAKGLISCGQNGLPYYKLAYETKKSVKAWVKYCLAKMHLIGFFV